MISHWRRLPARTRLTVWYVTLLALMLTLAGVIGLVAIQRVLYTNADEVLRAKSSSAATDVEIVKGRLTFKPEDPSLYTGLDILRMWDGKQRLAYHQELLQGVPTLDDATIASILEGGTMNESVTSPDGRVRLFAEPVIERGKIIGIVQVGRSEEDIEAILAQLRSLGMTGLAISLIFAWAAGNFLASRALTPVTDITQAAEQINAEDLSRRLTVPESRDEFHRLALAFNGMIGRIDAAFERQRQFTADASHELRTPLAVIRSQVDVALGRPTTAPADALVYRSVAEETERLRHLLENLLLLARADQGEQIPLSPIDLDELVEEVGSRFVHRAHEKGVRISLQISEGGMINGSKIWLTQLVINLVDNAVRYTPTGGLVTLAVMTNDSSVQLSVTDTGEGIAPEHLPHLVERFYRTERARSRDDGGAGLGLAICNWIAQAHDGQLEITSALGQGTNVTVSFSTIRKLSQTESTPPLKPLSQLSPAVNP